MTSLLLSKGLPAIFKGNQHAGVGKWMLGTAGMVVGMINVGGLTRLTGSGLSMTTWHPLDYKPPMTAEEWEIEFARYKLFPEWEQRRSMTLHDFKYIYAWEYGHRMLGRCVGLVFVAPWAYFSVRGMIPAGYQPRMVGLLCMGGGQGLVGWWMVKSGLGEDRRGDSREIRVKPYRLATHLSMAFATYAALLWTGWDVLGIQHKQALKDTVANMSKDALKHATRLRAGGFAVTGLTAVTIVSGALVAGNDAGRAYNTFPKMNDEWIPHDILAMSPWGRNFTENTATVQFNHRILGTATAVSALTLYGLGKGHLVTPQARKGLLAIGLAATGQMTLGIVTLLNYVPISLAAAHQLGAVVVMTSGLYLCHSLRYAKPALIRAAKQVAK
jgi:heme a synthase